MMISHTWSIKDMERDASTGGVSNVHWNLESADGDVSINKYGVAGFSPDPESASFIPFDQLEETTVVQWVKDFFGDEVQSMELDHEKQVEAIKNPEKIKGVPW